MRAMVLTDYGQDLISLEIPVPVPGDLDVVLRVHACGVCRTDLKIVDGELADAIHLPHIPGHEIAGEVVECGRGVGNLKPGDRGVVYFLLGCGECEMCRTGRENLCFRLERLGFEHPGGYGEYVKVPARNLSVFSDSASWEKMAVLPDAVATPFHVFNTLTNLKPGHTVLVVGVGGLGLSAVQIAVHMGLRVFVADLREEALEAALNFGADRVFQASDPDIRENIREASRGLGVDLVLEGVGRAETLRWSLLSLKKDGTCVIMGYDPVNPVPIPLLHMHNNQWRLIGTKVSTRHELDEVVRLVESGAIDPVIDDTLPFTRVNEGLHRIRRGDVCGRIVLTHGEEERGDS